MSRGESVDRSRPSLVREAGWLAVVVLAIGLFLLVAPLGPSGNAWVAGLAVLLSAIWAMAACLKHARDAAEPAAWRFLGLGLAFYASAEAYWFVNESVLGRPVPGASIADPIYYLGYAAVLAALAGFFPRAIRWRERTRRIIDAITIAAALFAIAWLLVLRDVVAGAGPGLAQALVATAYPVLDLALIGLLLLLASEQAGAHRKTLAILGVGVGLWAVADAAYAYLVATSHYASGRPLDVAWVAGYLAFGLAARQVPTRAPGPFQQVGVGRTSAFFVYVPVVAVLILAVVKAAIQGNPVDDVSFAVGVLLVAALGGRQILLSSDLMTNNRRLLRTQELYVLTGRATKDVVYDYDVATRRLAWGDAIWEIFGHKPATLAPDDSSRTGLIHPEDRPRIVQAFEATLEGPSNEFRQEYRFRRADGSWAHVLDRFLVTRDDAGRAVRAVGAMSDVTKERESSDQLARQEKRHREMMDRLDEMFLSTDLVTGKVYVSAAAERIFGRPRVAFERDPMLWTSLIHPEDQPRVQAGYARVLQGEVVHSEARIVRPDGSVCHTMSSIHPVFDPAGKVVRIEGVLRDVSAERHATDLRLEAEKMRAAAEFKTRFLNNAAHELATPLTPLKLQLATLHGSTLAKAEPEAFALLERNVNRLGTLVNDLLDAARLQSGGLKLLPTEVVISEILGRVAASFNAQARVAGLTIGVEPPIGRVQIVCDETRLEQVLFNLVHNAVKFTPRGGQIWLSHDVDGQHAVLHVRDTGSGLSSEQAAHLFQPFVQVHDPAKFKGGGTGLGLYIARGIVEQHGGRLDVTSPGPGHGSTFTVSLPLKATLPAAASPLANAATPPRGGAAPDARRAAP